MQDFPYEYNATVRIADGGDPRAIGGAVTVALCGHWEHDGPCRWPHHTATVPIGSGSLAVTTRFACTESEEAHVRAQIAAALATGSLEHFDGRATAWTVVG
jgi:hypothetical protein